MKFLSVLKSVLSGEISTLFEVGRIENYCFDDLLLLKIARHRNGSVSAVLWAPIPVGTNTKDWKFENTGIEFDSSFIRIPYKNFVQVNDDIIRHTLCEVPFFKGLFTEYDSFETIGTEIVKFYSKSFSSTFVYNINRF